MALIDLDSPAQSGSRFIDLDAPVKEVGGFAASAKQAFGSTVKGIGQAAADFIPGVDAENAFKKYGESVIAANPTAVHELADIPDKPWTTAKEATGNAASSIAQMLGVRAVGQGITAAAPFTGPLAPAVALAGQIIAWAGPVAIAALPSYGSIRDKQILDDPEMQADGNAKAVAALGAAAVGAIETRFGPQNWALAAMTKEGRAEMAKKLGVDAADGFLKKAAKLGGKGALIEGGEELVQNPIEQLAAFDDPTTEKNLKDTLFGGVMGAIGGGVIGGGFAVVSHKREPVKEILQAPDADTAINAALDGATMADVGDFNVGAVPDTPAFRQGLIQAQITALTEPAYEQKQMQDEAALVTDQQISEEQRAAQVGGFPDPGFKLTEPENAELARLVQERAAATPAPLTEQAAGGTGLIAEQLSRARRVDETQSAYEARLKGQVETVKPVVQAVASATPAAPAVAPAPTKAATLTAVPVQPTPAAQQTVQPTVQKPTPTLVAAAVQPTVQGKAYTPAEGVTRFNEQHGRDLVLAERHEAPAPARVAATAVEKKLGLKVVFVKDGPSGHVAEGFMHPDDTKTVYVNVNSKRLFQPIVMHETTHAMKRRNPKVYDELQRAVNSALTRGAFEWAEKKYGQVSKEIQNEEIVANIVGDQGGDFRFWVEVFKETKDVRALVKALFAGIDQLNAKLNKTTGLVKDGHDYNTRAFVNDAKAVRKAVAKAYAEWERSAKVPRNVEEKTPSESVLTTEIVEQSPNAQAPVQRVRRGESAAPAAALPRVPQVEHAGVAPGIEEVGEALTSEEKISAARALGQKSWSNSTAKKFISKYAEWLQQGAKDVTSVLGKLFQKVLESVKTGALSVAVAFNFNVAQYQQPVAASFTEQIIKTTVGKPRADFTGVESSSEAALVADWFVRGHRQGGQPFIIADKTDGFMYAFDASGKLLAKSPAIFGKTKGDVLTTEQAGKSVAETTDKDKITPAGVFQAEGRVKDDKAGVTVAEYGTTTIAIHTVYLGTPSEKRMERLQSQNAEDKRVSYGCINALPGFIDDVIAPNFSGKSKVVIVPEMTAAAEFFEITDKATEEVSKTAQRKDESAAAPARGDGASRREEALQSKPDTQTETPAFKKWFGESKVVGRGEKALQSKPDITETPAFKAWFGKSVVTTTGKPGGKPMEMYHGTGRSFGRFETGKNTTEGAAFFTTDGEIASGFAIPGDFSQDAKAFGKYLLKYEDLGDDRSWKANVVPVYLRVTNPMVVDFADVSRDGNHSFDAMRETVKRARTAGHDGLRIIGAIEGLKERDSYPDQWAVFSPRQIKSAIGNRGTFDPKSPNILQSKPDRSTEPFRPANANDKSIGGVRIPPGWTDVYVAVNPDASLVAIGDDKRGRTQYLYSAAHTAQAAVEKFERLRDFNAALPGIMERVNADAATSEEAAVLRLIAHTGFRIGAAEVRGEVEAIGATTLRTEHVTVDETGVNFDFPGKRGVQQDHSVTDAAVVRDIEQRIARGNDNLFDTNDTRVRNYLRSITGGKFKVHDFRTWNATDAARQAMAEMPMPRDDMAYWDQRDRALEAAARKIGDTLKVAEESYVDEFIFEEWRQSAGIEDGATRPRRVNQGARRADEGARRDAPRGEGERALQSKPDQAAGESAANPVVTARHAVALDKANPLAKDRLGRCHQLTMRKAVRDDLRQIIGVVSGFPKAPRPRAPIKIWHSVAYDQKTGNFWEPISDRWYTPAAMKAFDFEPVVSITSEQVVEIAMKTRKVPDQQIYSENVKPLRGAESDWLQPGDYDADWKVVGRGEKALQSKPDITETPAFKAWFGKSVVTTTGKPGGKPMEMYHGTNVREDFNSFQTTGSEMGSHFGTSEQADQAVYGQFGHDDDDEPRRIMPVYLSIKNPLRLMDSGRFDAKGVAQQLEDIGFLTEAQAEQFYDEDTADEGKLQKILLRKGYDGIVYLNRREGYNQSASVWADANLFGLEVTDKQWKDKHPDAVDSYIAFRPEQIKSAIGNRGTFNPKSKSILESKPDEDDDIGSARWASGADFDLGEPAFDDYDSVTESGDYTMRRGAPKTAGIPRIVWAQRPAEGDWISETAQGRYTIEQEGDGFWAKKDGESIRFEKKRGDAVDYLNALYEEDVVAGEVEDPNPKNPTKRFKKDELGRMVAGLKRLAEVPGIFLSGKSDKKKLSEVLADMDSKHLVQGVSVEGVEGEKVRYRINLGDHGAVWVFENKRDKVIELDAEMLKKGSTVGSFLYPAIFTWGANNEMKVMVHSAGLSPINRYRRTEQMLSAALRLGTTKYMSPIRAYVGFNDQMMQGWNENPKNKKEEDENLALLAVVSMSNTLEYAPDAMGYRYDFLRKQFVEGKRVLDKAKMRDVLSKDSFARSVGIGPTTLARAIFTNTLLHNTKGAQEFISGKIGASSILQEKTEDQALALYSKPSYINTPTAESAARKAGLYREEKPLIERIREQMPTFVKRMRQGLVDQFSPIKEVSYRAYMMARMSMGTDGSLEAMFLYGKPYLEDGALNVNMKDGGLTKVLQKLGGEHDRFIAWIAGNRAAQLKTEGRERLFEDAEIDWLKNLNQGNMPGGGSRAALYAQVHKEFNAYSKAVLDIAEQQGLIDPESRAVWEKDFYVPFYRNMDDGIAGPTVKSGMVSQQAFKRLKGGKEELNDLLANTLQNWSHLLSASMKNKAALTTMEAAVAAGVAIEAPTEYAAKQMQIGKVLKAMDGGVERYFVLEDPFLVDAISSLESFSFGPIGKLFETVKRWLTIGVTANPSFKIRNLIRDSVSAIGVSELGYNPLKNVSSAWADTAHSSQLRASLLASGGIIRFGTQLEGSRAEYVRDLINDGVPASQILDTKDKVVGALKLMWERYQEFGDRGENVNRTALYKKMRAEGMDHLEASFAARDLMDFSMQGTWRAIRFLSQTVPFFNARLQGLYKGVRGAAENPRRMGYVMGAVALASIALMLAYKDDDDWKKREDYDRDNFWWFKIGDKAFRIPKPFEIGAMGTMAERMVEYAVSDEMTGKRLAQRLAHIVGDNLAMNPIPQIARPLIELYANKDFFRGRPIETMGMEKLSTAERIGRGTSGVAQLAGKAGVLSPVQIDHVVRAYFGWLGASAVTLLDYGVRPAMGMAERPSKTLKDVFVAGNFIESLPTNSSRYVTDFYESSKKIEQAYADWRHAINTRQPERAAEIRAANKDEIAQHGRVLATNKQLAAYNKLEKLIEADKTMSPDEKRKRLDRIDELKNLSAKRYSDSVLRRGKGEAAVTQ